MFDCNYFTRYTYVKIYVAHLKYIRFLFVNHISVKMERIKINKLLFGAGAGWRWAKGQGNGDICNSVNNKNKIKKT